MSDYATCSDWAAAQTTGSSDAKLLLMLLTFDIDKGKPGATMLRLAYRAEMSDGFAVGAAIRILTAWGLIEIVGTDRGNSVYAPKGWLK